MGGIVITHRKKSQFTTRLQNRFSSCVSKVESWMRANRLQLNTMKTEMIWSSSQRRQRQISDSPFAVVADAVSALLSSKS